MKLVRRKWLGSSFKNANVASSGTADSFLKAAHVLKTINAHKVTTSALYTLLKSAYDQHT